jgi:hypothetical protein
MRPELDREGGTERACTVVDFTGVGGGDSAGFAECGWYLRYLIFPVSFSLLILIDGHVFLPLLPEFDGDDLVRQQTLLLGLQVSSVGQFAVVVLVLTCNF